MQRCHVAQPKEPDVKMPSSPLLEKLEPQPNSACNSSWRITSPAKELLPLLRGANAMWMQGVLGRLWMMLEILNLCRLMISLIRTADFVEKIQSQLRLCEEDGHQTGVPIQIFNSLPFVLGNSWHYFEFHSVSLILFRSMQGFKSVVWDCHIETVALFNCDCLALRCFCKSELFHPCTDESWHVRHPTRQACCIMWPSSRGWKPKPRLKLLRWKLPEWKDVGRFMTVLIMWM